MIKATGKGPTPEAAIRQAIAGACSDGNADAKRVARDVVRALERAGFEIVEMKPFNDWALIDSTI
jgi:hypothetical protein